MEQRYPVGKCEVVLSLGDITREATDAIANAANNHQLDPNSLYVSEAYVNEGPTMKRFRPRAQGRAFRIRKRTSHITVVVEPRPTTRKKG